MCKCSRPSRARDFLQLRHIPVQQFDVAHGRQTLGFDRVEVDRNADRRRLRIRVQQADAARLDQAADRIRRTGPKRAFEDIKLSPNTLDCHRLVLWSRADNVQSDVVERLFKAYFMDGEDLTRADTLVRISEEAGMESDLVEQLLETETDLDKTEAQIAKAQESGITGVPCFIIDGRFVLAGAERAETIAAALMHAEETRSDPDAI